MAGARVEEWPLELDRSVVRVGEIFRCSLRVELNEGRALRLDDAEPQGSLQVVQQRSSRRADLHTLEWDLLPCEPGEQRVGPMRLTVLRNGKTEKVVTTQSVTLKVLSHRDSPQDDLEFPPELGPLEGGESEGWPAWIGGLGVLLLAAGLWCWRRRRRALHESFDPPFSAELARIRRRCQQGDPPALVMLDLHRQCRRIVEREMALPVGATTEELLDALRVESSTARSGQGPLKVWTICERIKFACEGASQAEAGRALEEVEEWYRRPKERPR